MSTRIIRGSIGSMRACTVNTVYCQPSEGHITGLVIDSTGLKVLGEGEWVVRKRGTEMRRAVRMLTSFK